MREDRIPQTECGDRVESAQRQCRVFTGADRPGKYTVSAAQYPQNRRRDYTHLQRYRRYLVPADHRSDRSGVIDAHGGDGQDFGEHVS